jgi:hypothetical protein
MANFPSFTPTARRYTPGVYPQKTFRTLSGVTVRRTFGNSPYGAQLELQYENVPDATVDAFLDHYHSQTASNSRFRLSDNVTAGMSSALTAEVTSYTANRGNLRWEYEKPPEVQSVRPGIYTITITLLGEIRNTTTDDA